MLSRAQFLQQLQVKNEYITVPLSLVKVAGNHHAAIMLSRIIYWHSNGKDGKTRLRVEKDGQKWLAKSWVDWNNECLFSAKQSEVCTALLKKKKLINVRAMRFNGLVVRHYQLNWTELITQWQASLPKNKPAKRRSTIRKHIDKGLTKTLVSVDKGLTKAFVKIDEKIDKKPSFLGSKEVISETQKVDSRKHQNAIPSYSTITTNPNPTNKEGNLPTFLFCQASEELDKKRRDVAYELERGEGLGSGRWSGNPGNGIGGSREFVFNSSCCMVNKRLTNLSEYTAKLGRTKLDEDPQMPETLKTLKNTIDPKERPGVDGFIWPSEKNQPLDVIMDIWDWCTGQKTRRTKRLYTLLKFRMKEDYFVDNWQEAVRRCKMAMQTNDFVYKSGFLNFHWLVKDDQSIVTIMSGRWQENGDAGYMYGG